MNQNGTLVYTRLIPQHPEPAPIIYVERRRYPDAITRTVRTPYTTNPQRIRGTKNRAIFCSTPARNPRVLARRTNGRVRYRRVPVLRGTNCSALTYYSVFPHVNTDIRPDCSAKIFFPVSAFFKLNYIYNKHYTSNTYNKNNNYLKL